MAKSKGKSRSKPFKAAKNAIPDDDFDELIAESKRENANKGGQIRSSIGLMMALLISIVAVLTQNPAVSKSFVGRILGWSSDPDEAYKGMLQSKEADEPIKNTLMLEKSKVEQNEGQKIKPKSKHPESDPGSVQDTAKEADTQRRLLETWKTKTGADALLTWFKENGGWMSENLMLEKIAIGNGLRAVSYIKKEEEVFKIPDTLQMNPRGVIAGWNKTSPDLMLQTKNAVNKNIRNKFDQQDMIIALQLMIECAMGGASFWFPYLQIIPEYVPRLDYYNEKELALLQDTELHQMSVTSKRLIQEVWEKIQEAGSWSKLLDAATDNPDPKCLTYEMFHHFIAIVGSRAFILRNIKYISPVADMVNHRESPEAPVDLYAKKDVDLFKEGFNKYHKRLPSTGVITVLADRDTEPGSPYEEEYGTLDNSLYISKFGFVPLDNPHHCAVIDVPQPSMEETAEILRNLKLNSIDSLCINRDGTIALGAGRHGKAYFGVIGLEALPDQLVACQGVQGDFTVEVIDKSCVIYPGAKEATNVMIRKIAKKSLESAETTLADDIALLDKFQNGEALNGMNPVHAINALQFRIEEKKILMQIDSALGANQIV
jgi:hypothetical protein